MSLEPDLLYSWLPAYVRARDLEEGEPLRALMATAQEVYSRIHDDVGRLHRNWFIETCQEWVVPYVGDQVGISRLRTSTPRAYTLRAYVANAIALRRRKGTPAALEQVAHDVTGWHASVLEMFQLISTTQHVDHPRPHSLRTPSLGDAGELDRLYGPFERTCHTPDVRAENRYHLQAVSLFLWRLDAWPMALAPAARHASAPAEGSFPWFHFNPLGQDLPLFNFPQTRLEASSLVQEHHLPAPLRRSALLEELDALRQAEVDGREPVPAWFGNQPPFRIYLRDAAGGALSEVPPSRILTADLARCGQPEWLRPPGERACSTPSGEVELKPITAVVDPELGRLVFTAGSEPREDQEVLVDYFYGFASDLGGGAYDRHAELPDREGFSRYVVSGERGLAEQIQQWLADAPETPGAVFELADSSVYTLDAGRSFEIPEGKQVEIRAANRQRPVIDLGGRLELELPANAGLTLNGLCLCNGAVAVTVDPEGPAAISVVHCTLVPGTPLQILTSGGTRAALSVSCAVRRSILGALELGALGPGCALEIEESIIDHPAGTAIQHGGALRIQASTVLGKTRAAAIDQASGVIFTDTVSVERLQAGCVRYSYVPPGSEIPSRFRCQPEVPEGMEEVAREALLHRLRPRFTSTQYGQPGYGQLAFDLPDELLRGAEDEGEMGAFNHLEQSHRRLGLQLALEEHLRVGLDVQIVFVT